MAQVRSISVKSVHGTPKAKDFVNESKIKVMTVYGTVVGIKIVEGKFENPGKCLVGQFEAVNPVDGEIHQASNLYLPDVALTPLEVQLSFPGVKGVEFAIDLYANEDETAARGYTYSFEHLMPPAADDPIQKIKAKLGMIPLFGEIALPAPEVAEEIEEPIFESKTKKRK